MGIERLKTALVAGGAGFIGSNLCEFLLKKNYRVIAVDNYITGFSKNLAKCVDKNFTFLNVDISKNSSELEDIAPDVIFHLASPASPPKYLKLPHETIRANIQGTENLLNLAKKKTARLIFSSTSEIYGDPQISPQPETYWGNVNPIGPRSIYDESKRMGETLCALYSTEGVNVGIMRLFNTYGPYMDPYDGRVVSTFIRQALRGEPYTIYGTGEQTRSFCYIDDLISAIHKFSLIDYLGPINLGNPNEMTMLELASVVSNVLEVDIPIKHLASLEDDPQTRNPDISLAINLLDWKPETNLELGISKTAKWIKSNI